MGSQIIYEWGTCTGVIRRLRFEIVNIEIMQHVFVNKKICWRYWYGTDWSLEYGGILYLTDLWWRILPKIMSPRPLLANDSFRKERLSISSFLIPTGLKSLWPAISKTIAVSLYSFEFGFVTLFYQTWVEQGM